MEDPRSPARETVVQSDGWTDESKEPGGATLVSTSPPPPPHDPAERDLALMIVGWEVRVFGNRKFQYFVTRGLWHLQLWHPVARISILTPSRLTDGLYEAFPVANWKARAQDYDHLVSLVARLHREPFPSKALVLRIQKALVDDVVGADCRPVS